jgi:hypothetical protein
MIRNKPWTEADDRRLMELATQGRSEMMIGLALPNDRRREHAGQHLAHGANRSASERDAAENEAPKSDRGSI